MELGDIGPYEDVGHAAFALAGATTSIPGARPEMRASASLGNALAVGLVETTEYERRVLVEVAQLLPAPSVQVLAGIIARAAIGRRP